MKIAFVIDGLGSGGGVEGYLQRAAHFLVAAGDEVELILGHGAAEGPWRVRTLVPNVRGRATRMRAFADAYAALARDAAWESSLAIRHVRGAHVYQPHGGLIEASARARDATSKRAILARLRRGYRRVSPRARVMRSLEVEAMERSRQILALSPLVLDQIRTRYPEALAKSTLHELGVDLEAFSPQGARFEHPALRALPDATPLVLFAAFNLRLKGVVEAAEALLVDPALSLFHLAIAGPIEPAVLPRTTREALVGRLHWLGPQRDMAALYRRAHVLLHPTWYDPCSTVALEALACGCPVVTTRANGVASLASEALAVVADPRDARGLASALSHLVASGARIRAIARSAAELRSEREHFVSLREHLYRAAGPLLRS